MGSGVPVELVTHDWDRFDEVLDLSYDVLYRAFGVAREGDWYHPAHGSEFAVALAGGGSLSVPRGSCPRQATRLGRSGRWRQPRARRRGKSGVHSWASRRVAVLGARAEAWLSCS